jgi:curli biogenesis system outer membrane secretion channel CsgG
MKSSGLDSTFRNQLKKANKVNRFANQQSNRFAALERQKREALKNETQAAEAKAAEAKPAERQPDSI